MALLGDLRRQQDRARTDWCQIGKHGSWQTIVPFHQQFPFHKQWLVTLYYSVKSDFGTEFLPLDIALTLSHSMGLTCSSREVSSPLGNRVARAEDSGDLLGLPINDACQDQVQAAAGVHLLPQASGALSDSSTPPSEYRLVDICNTMNESVILCSDLARVSASS